ncbi:MAG: GNAT family N-acetyltransferase [Pseudomonadota bacterium]
MLNLDFTDSPVLSTERLILRPLTPQDAGQIHKLRSDPAVNAYIGRAVSTGVPEAAAFIEKIRALISEHQGMYWGISLRQYPDLIGTICYWNFDLENAAIEIGYELLPEFQGRGLMSEAVKRVIAYGFEEMQAKIITAFLSTDNKSSVALLENAQFKLDDNYYANMHDNVKGAVTYTLRRPGTAAE